MQGVGKGSIVVEFWQRLQGHDSRKIFCCSVPLTIMRPPQANWLNLPLTQKGSIPRAWVTGHEPDVPVRRSHFVGCGGEPGMIHRNHLGITGNRGNGEFDGHWLALVTLAKQNKRVAWCFI
ncbi:hypothetical protein TNCV_2018961 [Trichonephila clavipes]|nr:hypothetical protein TNCV_2018961 [Trichonephila clavipes]